MCVYVHVLKLYVLLLDINILMYGLKKTKAKSINQRRNADATIVGNSNITCFQKSTKQHECPIFKAWIDSGIPTCH